MRTILTRLLLLFSVLLMPLGMAPAAASEMDHSAAMAMPMSHCPDQAPSHDTKGGIALCGMACSAAVPASIATADGPLPITVDVVRPSLFDALHGLHPDTATPPPRAA